MSHRITFCVDGIFDHDGARGKRDHHVIEIIVQQHIGNHGLGYFTMDPGVENGLIAG